MFRLTLAFVPTMSVVTVLALTGHCQSANDQQTNRNSENWHKEFVAAVNNSQTREALRLITVYIDAMKERPYTDSEMARARQIQGLLFNLIGDYGEADRAFQEAVSLRRKLFTKEQTTTNSDELASALLGWGTSYNMRRDYPEALSQLLEAFAKAADSQLRGKISNELGMASLNVGDLTSAERWLNESLRSFVGSNEDDPNKDTLAVSETYANLGRVQVEMGRAQSALKSIQRAERTQRRILGDKNTLRVMAQLALANTLNIYSDTLMTENRLSEAEKLCRESLELLSVAPPEYPGIRRCLTSLSFCLMRQRRFAEADDLINKATRQSELAPQIAKNTYDLTIMSALLLHYGKSRSEEALSILGERLREARKQYIESSLYQSIDHQLQGIVNIRLLLDSWLTIAFDKKLPSAAIYQEVFYWKSAASQKAQTTEDSRQCITAVRRASDHLEAILQSEAATPEKQEIRHRDLQKATDEFLKASQELSKVLPTHFGMQKSDTPDALSNALPEDVAVIDYFTYRPHQLSARSPTIVMAFVVRHGGKPVCVQLPADGDKLNKVIHRWQAALGRFQEVDGNKALSVEARALGDIVLEPLRPYLAGARHLVICPDGKLSEIPFAALPGTAPDTFLIEEMAVSYAGSGRHVLDSLTVPRPSKVSGALILDGGEYESVKGKEKFASLVQLNEVGDNLRALFGTKFPNEEVVRISGKAATRKACLDALDDGRRMVLIVGHGEVPASGTVVSQANDPTFSVYSYLSQFSRPLQFCLLLGDGSEESTMRPVDLLERSPHPSNIWIVLVCGGATGPTIPGEWPMALSWIVHRCGGRAVVASLWTALPPITLTIANQFHDNLFNKGLSKVDALQKAQIDWLTNAPKEYRHPAYWANWILSGDYGPLIENDAATSSSSPQPSSESVISKVELQTIVGKAWVAVVGIGILIVVSIVFACVVLRTKGRKHRKN